jgi:hypothetical protein
MIKKIQILCLFLGAFISTSIWANSTIISVNNFSDVQKMIAQVKDPRHLLLTSGSCVERIFAIGCDQYADF